MTKNNREIYERLASLHEDAQCELNFSTPFELLVAVILSAQCTDKRVNLVTEKLFKIASTPQEFVDMPIEELEEHIRSCGFYHNKAKALKEMSASLLAMGGVVPDTREELMKLSGVGRKTANVVSAVAFGKNAIAVDTHVFRVSNRIGIADANTPEKVEEQLMAGFDEEIWSKLHHYLIFHGRYVCKAQKPNCGECTLKNSCKYYKNNKN
ncbi:MAG: endonuclease III [Clostridia bacterium]|nr:endonuclease III [Clostridia bacterium]